MSDSEPEIDPQLIAAIEAINAEDPTANMGVEPSDPASRNSPTPASTEEGAGVGAAANQPSPASTPDAADPATVDELIKSALDEDQGEQDVPGAPEPPAPTPPAGAGDDEDDLASILEEHLGHKPSIDEIVGLITALEAPPPGAAQPAQPAAPPYQPAPPAPAPAPAQFQPVAIPPYADDDVKQALEAQNRQIAAMNQQLEANREQQAAWEAEQIRAAEAEQQRFMANVQAGYNTAKTAFYEANPGLTTRQQIRLEKQLQTDGRVWAFVQSAATPAEGIQKFYEFMAYSDDDIRSTIDASRAAEAQKKAEESAKRKARASAAAGGGGAIPRENTVVPTTKDARDKAALAMLDEAFANPAAE